jgi:hypothetical protein
MNFLDNYERLYCNSPRYFGHFLISLSHPLLDNIILDIVSNS